MGILKKLMPFRVPYSNGPCWYKGKWNGYDKLELLNGHKVYRHWRSLSINLLDIILIPIYIIIKRKRRVIK